MDVYHGTTQSRARRIFDEGFLPFPPSRRVWFAEARGYAMGRAETQAKRANDTPVVLVCGLELPEIRRELGGGQVVYRKGIIAIDGPLPVQFLHSISLSNLATTPREVAAWANALLGLRPGASVVASHPGVVRLSRWINATLASEDGSRLLSSELIERAERWLPEYFTRATVGPRRLRAHRRIGLTDYAVHVPRSEPDPREGRAFDLLAHPRADHRARGLSLLAELGDPDLFDWCAMLLDDRAAAVRTLAVKTMIRCDAVNLAAVEPLVEAEDRAIRAGAIARLAKHGAGAAPRWIKLGLRDPEPCVRLGAARFLSGLDPRRHRALIKFATQDPNPDIARRARELLAGRRKKA